MNRNTAFILSILSLIHISCCAMTENSYRTLCIQDNLPYQKQLICKKHKARLTHQQLLQKEFKLPATSIQQTAITKITPKAPQHKALPQSFKEERIAKRARIKPYIPGAYKKPPEGESK